MPEERKIGCDVDGVVADFLSAAIEASGTKKKREDFNHFDLKKTLNEKEYVKAIAAMEDPNFWLNLGLIPGAKHRVRLLKARGFDFIWITSPWQNCPGWGIYRWGIYQRAWIEENFGDDPVIIDSDKAGYDADIFIDDKVDNVKAWKKAHPDKLTLLYDAPYNKEYGEVPRVTWDTIEWFI